MKKIITLLFIISFVGLFAQSNHTITVDGTINTSSGEMWSNVNERFSTSSGTTVYGYITWDADNIYVAWPQVDFDGWNQACYVVIDTDPQQGAPKTGNGTDNLGFEQWFLGSTVTAPFNADLILMVKESNSALEKNAYLYSGGQWNKNGANSTTNHTNSFSAAYGNENSGKKDIEFSINRSAIGVSSSTDQIHVIVYCKDLDNNSGWGYLHRAIPDNGTTDGTNDKVFTHYYGYTLVDGLIPNSEYAYDDILDKNYKVLDLRSSTSYFYIDDNTNNELDVTNVYTFECWVYMDAIASGRIFVRGTTGGRLYINTSDNSLRFDNGSGGATFRTGANSILTGKWYHVAISSDGINTRMFLNGTQVDGAGALSLTTSSDPLYIGANNTGTSPFAAIAIDEFRYSKVARYTSNFDISRGTAPFTDDANTILLFHFDDDALPPTNSAGTPSPAFTVTNGGIIAGNYINSNDPSLDETLPLPVELTSFTALPQGEFVNLTWETATEVNNYGFEIERSVVGTTHELSLQWDKVGFVEGHGNSNSVNQYSFTDNTVIAGQAYSYRLKQIDFDGQFEYSSIVNVEAGIPTEFNLEQNYPNPFNPTTSISFSLPKAAQVNLSVYNVLGEKVAQLINTQMEAGKHNINFNASNLSTGTYIYRIETPEFSTSKKMMLVK